GAVPPTDPTWTAGGAAGGGVVAAGASVDVDFVQPDESRRTAAPTARTIMIRRIALSSFIALVVAAAAGAQQIWVGGGRFWRTPPKWAKPENFDGSFNFCR